ncbi:MAG: hypothetical protein ACI4UE_05535 [Candidatus Scatovivens sp.]
MNKYKVGTVFELFENNNQEYMILDTFEKENFVYAFVTPINTDKKGVTKTDYTKAMLIKINKITEEMKIETDERIIAEAVDSMISKI